MIYRIAVNFHHLTLAVFENFDVFHRSLKHQNRFGTSLVEKASQVATLAIYGFGRIL